MAIDQNAQKSLFDALYCDDENWGEIDEEESEITLNINDFNSANPFLFEQDLIWDDGELQSLFLKEKETCFAHNNIINKRFSYSLGRKEAIEWILKINAHFGFSALTAILAVNYLDRFLSTLSFEKDMQPWMMQLAAVTCLSLAAKVEETHVPLLLELQVGGGTEYVFEAKNIQRMELLVLSALKWRMNPVTPLSFIDHIFRRLRFKSSSIHFEFLHSCENLLLSVLSDSRFVHYVPSVLATATMLHVMHQCIAIDCETQILTILKISKEEVDDCYEFISENGLYPKNINLSQIQNSPSGVTDAIFFTCDDRSNDSCISASPHQPIYKKSRVQEQKMKLPSLSRFFVDAVVGSPHH